MTLEEMANLAAACDGQGVQLGDYVGCVTRMGKRKHGVLVRKGLRYPKDTEFNDAFLYAEEQKGNIIVLANAEKIDFTPSEDTYITKEDGEKTLDERGLPEFVLRFEKNHHFYKNLSILRSKDRYDYFDVDIDNNFGLADYGEEGFGGFDAGHVTPSMVFNKVTGEAEYQTLTVQLVDRNQYDQDSVYFSQNNHAISFKKHIGVNPMVIQFVGNVGAGTGARLKITLADRKTPVSGVTPAMLQAAIGGNVDAIVSLTEDPTTLGEYDLVITTAMVAANALSVKSWDDTEKVGNIQLSAGGSTKLFYAESVETIVV